MIKNPNELTNAADWLFWLTDEGIPQSISARKIFRYAKGREINTASWFKIEGDVNKEEEGINLSRIIQSGKGPASVDQQKIWSDGYGNPLLTLDQKILKTYTLYTHFNPEWNGLVWSKSFPEMLLQLLYPLDDGFTHPYDQRVIDVSQMLPDNRVSQRKSKQKFTQVVLLEKLFWLFAFAMFCLERFLSFKIKKEAAYG